jgi:hypothetical protein
VWVVFDKANFPDNIRRMRLERVLTVFLLVCFVSSGIAASEYKPSKGKDEVATLSTNWHDTKRNREVPVKIYYPKDATNPVPVIIFSHGLGGSRDGYVYLGNEWASHGYVSVHVQHQGSDSAIFARGMSRGVQEGLKPVNASNRVVDIYFAISALEKMNAEAGPLYGKLDLQNIGVGGHSYGAWTTLVVGGEKIVRPDGTKLPWTHPEEPRIKALMPMSAPASKKSDLDWEFGSIDLPCFHMTGTLDDSPVTEMKASERRLPFDHMPAKKADEYLLTFNGGDHMVFSGRLSDRLARAKSDHVFQKYIMESSTAFWDAYLKNNKAAKEWLSGGSFKKELDDEGTFEEKLAPQAKP